MSWLDGLRHRLGTLLRPGAYAEELDEEMRHHLELGAMHAGDADRARRQFGSVARYKDQARDATWLRITDVVSQDLRAAWRGIARAPGLTLLVIATLALGLGANAATFSILDALYLRPPGGVPDPGSLRGYWVEHAGGATRESFTSASFNYPMYRAIRESRGAGARLAAYLADHRLRLGHELTGSRLHGVYATASYFEVLGLHPFLGRFYTSAEDSLPAPQRVVVVSHRFWRARLGADPQAIGTSLQIGPDRYTILGVLPPEFTGLGLQAADVWLPLACVPPLDWVKGPWWETPYLYALRVIERWPPAASQAAVEARALQAVRAVLTDLRGRDSLTSIRVGSAIESRGLAKARPEQVIATRLGGVAAIVLLIAWANVINLLLAHAVARRQEIAVRLALGISRARLVRLLTLETLLLALLASAAALLVAWGGGTALRALLLPDIQWYDSALDWRVAVFAALIAIGSGLVAGLIPAVQSSSPRLTEALKSGKGAGQPRSWLRNALVVAQAALAVTLLVGAALFVESLRNVRGVDIGYDPGRLLFGEVEFAKGAQPAEPVMAQATVDIESRLRGQPGIEAVARSYITPMWGFAMLPWWAGADSNSSLGRQDPTVMEVSPDFFRAAGIRILEGPGFSRGAGSVAPSEVIVDSTLARRLWPGGGALGQCMYLRKRESPCVPVVGVVEPVRRGDVLEPDPQPQFYLPLGSAAASVAGQTIVVRAGPNESQAATAEILAELRRAFPGALATVRPMTTILERDYRPYRLGAALFTAFGLLALAVAVIGIYSTIAYDVRQRTHEFGIRVALGAATEDLIRHIVGRGLRTVVVGVLAGVALALAGGRLIASLLYGVAPTDTATLLVVSALLLATAALAALVPAWRAARVDPMRALREE
jgi:predicted permease